MGVPGLDYAAIGLMAAWNVGAVWFFARWLPAKFDGVPRDHIPAVERLVPYTVEGPDTRGLV